MKENLEVNLEKERINLLRSSVITIQRYIRAYIARKRYQSIRSSAIRIQSIYRGYKCRHRYNSIRKGVVRAQANWRMKRQKREYIKVIVGTINHRNIKNIIKQFSYSFSLLSLIAHYAFHHNY